MKWIFMVESDMYESKTYPKLASAMREAEILRGMGDAGEVKIFKMRRIL